MFKLFNFKSHSQTETFKAYASITSVADIVDVQIPAYGRRTAVRFDTGATYLSLGFDAYLENIKAMIRFLASRNIEQKVIATFCKNRPEWDMTAMAAFYTANIVFPLDTKTNEVELRHLVSLNPPDYMLVSRAQLPRIRALFAELRLAPQIIVADLFDVFEDMESEAVQAAHGELTMREIVMDNDPAISVLPNPLLTDGDTVIGHYPTSGTLNLPKIVQVSHGNIIAEVNEAIDVINIRNNEDVLNIGPYTHIATLVEFLISKTRGFCVTYFTREPDDDDVLEDEIKKLNKLGVRVKVLMAVPKFWIYLLKELLDEMRKKPTLHKLYEHIVSIEKNQKLYDIGTIDKAKLTAMRILLRNKLGGYFSYGISSSMKLDGAIVEIFGKLGITVIDVYGATECCGIISRNRLNDVVPGTCGRIIGVLEHRLNDVRRVPGIEQPVGILEVRGVTVMHSYLGEAKGSSLDADGYFNTGDLCWIDSRNYLHLVGRQKELMLWDDGSYVDPQHLSNLLARNIHVKDALVTRLKTGDDFLSVFIYPDYQRIHKDPQWKKEIETGISEQAALRTRLEQAIDYAQSVSGITATLSKKIIGLLPKALERTPTHKIKFIVELHRLHLATAI